MLRFDRQSRSRERATLRAVVPARCFTQTLMLLSRRQSHARIALVRGGRIHEAATWLRGGTACAARPRRPSGTRQSTATSLEEYALCNRYCSRGARPGNIARCGRGRRYLAHFKHSGQPE